MFRFGKMGVNMGMVMNVSLSHRSVTPDPDCVTHSYSRLQYISNTASAPAVNMLRFPRVHEMPPNGRRAKASRLVRSMSLYNNMGDPLGEGFIPVLN